MKTIQIVVTILLFAPFCVTAERSDNAVRHTIRMVFSDEITSADRPQGETSPQSHSGTMIRVHELTGELSAIHADLMQKEWFSDETFTESAPVLWDLRNATLPNDVSYVSEVVQTLVQRSMNARPQGRASIVVSREFDFQILCQAYGESLSLGRMLITKSLADARLWLTGNRSGGSHPSLNHCPP